MQQSGTKSGLSFLPWIIPAALLFVWVLTSYFGMVPPYLLSPPWEILQSLYSYIFGGHGPYAGRFLGDFWASVVRVGIGFFVATLLGLPLGILSGRLAAANQLLNHFVNGIRAVPGITWLPLALVWFGIGTFTTVFLVAMAAFFPVYLNAVAGARQVDPVLLHAGAMMGVKRLNGVFRILLPAAMPHVVTGLRLGLGISWAYLVLGELTGVPNGLGAVIMDARMLGRVDIIIVGMILIAIIGQLSDRFLVGGLRFCLKSARRMT